MFEVRYRFYKVMYLLLTEVRDIREYLERKGFVIKMPDIILSSESRLSDTLGNNSRLVTKVRLEVINEHLKTCFAYFNLIIYRVSIDSLAND